MGRKIKKIIKAKAPPHSIGDIIIYFILCILTFSIMFLSIYLFCYAIPRHIALKDPTVLHFIGRGEMFVIPFPFVLVIYLTALLCKSLNSDFRFFHKRRAFKHDGLVKRVYPLFSRDWRDRPRKTEEQRKRSKKVNVAVLCILLVLASLIPFGLYGKTALHTDGAVAVYNYVGEKVEEYRIEDADIIKIRTYRTVRGRKRIRVEYHVALTMYFGEKGYSVKMNDELGGEESYAATLKYMLYVKSLYPDSKIVIEDDYYTEIYKHYELTDEEIRLLDELFEK